jgi:hypothetical protein
MLSNSHLSFLLVKDVEEEGNRKNISIILDCIQVTIDVLGRIVRFAICYPSCAKAHAINTIV